MKWLDRKLQRQRLHRALPWIRAGERLCDIGAHQGELLLLASERVSAGVGIDPVAREGRLSTKMELRRGRFPEALKPDERFHVITALAVIEHIPETQLTGFVQAIADRLLPGGRCILTVPHPRVDGILKVLVATGAASGMEHEAHHGYDVNRTIPLLTEAGLVLKEHKRFQFGLNHLFVFEKPLAQ